MILSYRGRLSAAEGFVCRPWRWKASFRFVVNTRENRFEPPHVHVWVGNEDVCRIELNGGVFMENPPPGTFRDIMRAYAGCAEEIRSAWDAIHGSRR